MISILFQIFQGYSVGLYNFHYAYSNQQFNYLMLNGVFVSTSKLLLGSIVFVPYQKEV
jgi:ABC-type polysaccharide transport system permease subunit